MNMTRQWIGMGILASLMTGCSHNDTVNQDSLWYQLNKQWIFSAPREKPSRLMNRALLIGTIREIRMEGISNGYVLLVDPKALECLNPCELPKEMLIAFNLDQFKQRQSHPGETWMIAVSQIDIGTKDGYWSLISAVPIHATN